MGNVVDIPGLDVLPAWVQVSLISLLALSKASAIFCASTSTPAPNTTWGKIYTGLEKFGAIAGKAKEKGVPVPTLEDVTKALLASVHQAIVTGKTIDPQMVLNVLGAKPVQEEAVTVAVLPQPAISPAPVTVSNQIPAPPVAGLAPSLAPAPQV